MAILAILSGEGINQKMYDTLREEVGWEYSYPPGAIFHAASFDADGNAHVADLWNSPQDFDEFVNTRLMPAMQKLNYPPPQVDVYPVHNVNAFASIQPHILS